VADEVHVVNVAVHTEFRRRGIARVLLQAVFDAARERGMTIATLEVRFHNLAAITLYESLGFQKIAIRKRYYADNGEDAVVMLKGLRTA
jgi:ribosomal-protein-alanine N-acetyltransferase